MIGRADAREDRRTSVVGIDEDDEEDEADVEGATLEGIDKA